MPYFKKYELKRIQNGCGFVVGIDEVGRGSFAGPLVVGLVVYNDYLQKLRGLDDSKKLSRAKREFLAKKIVKNCTFSLGVCWPTEIDSKGMAGCLKLAISRALGGLSVRPDYMFIDGNLKPDSDIDYENLIKGDSRVRSISAASIIAKVFRDNLMDCYNTLYNDFDWGSHVGYGTRKHRESILRFGPTHTHRMTFLRNLLNEENTTCR